VGRVWEQGLEVGGGGLPAVALPAVLRAGWTGRTGQAVARGRKAAKGLVTTSSRAAKR
jgi:hypothetical protein